MFDKVLKFLKFKRKCSVETPESLKGFLQAWFEWAQSPEIYPGRFRKEHGLCLAILDNSDDPEEQENGPNELKDLFIQCGLNDRFPFGALNYNRARQGCQQHEDHARLAWVKDALEGKLTSGWEPRKAPRNRFMTFIGF